MNEYLQWPTVRDEDQSNFNHVLIRKRLVPTIIQKNHIVTTSKEKEVNID